MRLKSLAAIAFLFAGTFVVLQQASASEAADEGKALYESLRCQTCHSIQSLDILARGDQVKDDLSEIGKTRDAEWLKRFLARDEGLEGVTQHRVPFRGTDEQLDSLATWLAGLGKDSE